MENGFSYPFAEIRKVLRSADLTVANLECVLASTGERAPKSNQANPYYFRGRPELVRVLDSVGVDVVNLANNHTMDYGGEALKETMGILSRAGITPVGAGANLSKAMAPVWKRVGDVVVAFIGLTTRESLGQATSRRAGNNWVSEDDLDTAVARVKKQVAAARRYAHLVFLTIHWGRNAKTKPIHLNRTLARRLVREAKVDAILGSDPHRVQGVENIDGRPVVCSPGDLLVDFSHRGRPAGIVRLYFNRQGVRWMEMIPTRRTMGKTVFSSDKNRGGRLRTFRDRTVALGGSPLTDGSRVMVRFPRAQISRVPEYSLPNSRSVPSILPAPDSYTPPQHRSQGAAGSCQPPRRVRFEKGIELLGTTHPDTAKEGWKFPVTTYWTSTQPISKSYQIKVLAKPSDKGRQLAAYSHQPGDWLHPTTRWRPGEIVRDETTVRGKGGKEGEYLLHVALQHGKRELKVIDPSQENRETRALLGSIDIR